MLQAIQLLVCDWLLTTRTEIWQRECGIVRDPLADSDDSDQEVTSTALLADDLMAFQHDLTSLRKLAHSLRAAMPRVYFLQRFDCRHAFIYLFIFCVSVACYL